jgi:calcineurin-like phosphoesterase family protein
MKNTWFTSDRHFDHKNIIRYCGRPFVNQTFYDASLPYEKQDKRFWDHEAMNEFMIQEHNKLVKPGDDVFDLGDFAFGRDASESRIIQHLQRMTGNLHFLWGNHDKLIKAVAKAQPHLFTWHSQDFGHTSPIVEYDEQGVKLVLCHYAMTSWHGSHKGVGHLYGHTHGTLDEGTSLRFDIGVDSWGFRPVHLDDVLSKLDFKRRGSDPRTLAGRFQPQYNFDDK